MPEIFYQLKLSLQNSLNNLYGNKIDIYTIMNVCLQKIIIYYTLNRFFEKKTWKTGL